MAPYMPTTWHDDELVAEAHTHLSEIRASARLHNRVLLLGGDFSAVAGERQCSDNCDFVAPFGIGNGNGRGELWAEWAASEKNGLLLPTHSQINKQIK